MNIIGITVCNFCSIRNVSISPSSFNIVVGQNNHGKTNFFEAVEWFYQGKGNIDDLRFGRSGDEEVFVEIEFSGAQDALQRMKNDKNRSSVRNVIGDRDTVRIKRSSADSKNRKIYNEGLGAWQEKNVAGFDSALNDFLPVFEYVDTRTHLADIAKFGRTTPVGTMLSAVLSSILETSQQYKAFREKFDELFTSQDSTVSAELNKLSAAVTLYVAKQFPDCTLVSFKIAEPAFEELLKGCSTEVDDGIITDASEKGDGMQRALMLAILQTYADFRKRGEAIGKNFLFFIDEAELHLHPTAQRQLKAALRDVAALGDQIFINTHSSVLIADEQKNQSIFRIEKLNKISYINPVSNSGKIDVIYELLGGSPADLLLPRNFMIVEGRCEFFFIKNIMTRFYPHIEGIKVIYAEGDIAKQAHSMDAINSLFAPLAQNPIYRDRLVMLCDKPHPSKQTDFEKFRKSYDYLEANEQLKVLSVGSIEDCYPQHFRDDWNEKKISGHTRESKVAFAERVSSNITEEQFSRDMPMVKMAIETCWKLAYK